MANTEHTYKEPKDSAEKVWVSEEYEAGYSARVQDVAECLRATPSWQAGWQEADREVAGTALAQPMLLSTDVKVPWSLFGTGHLARTCGLPFDEFSPGTWKRSWVAADIALGLAKRQGST